MIPSTYRRFLGSCGWHRKINKTNASSANPNNSVKLMLLTFRFIPEKVRPLVWFAYCGCRTWPGGAGGHRWTTKTGIVMMRASIHGQNEIASDFIALKLCPASSEAPQRRKTLGDRQLWGANEATAAGVGLERIEGGFTSAVCLPPAFLMIDTSPERTLLLCDGFYN